MGTKTYDADLGFFKFTPNTKYLSTNIRNQKIKRNVNSEGFLDLEHSKAKNPGIYRIGFFGDSNVESIQVPLKKTFFRIISDKLSRLNIETIAFGLSGIGTIHSYILSDKYSDLFDLDMAVYVFCENDLGDQIEEIRGAATLPYANLNSGVVSINDDIISQDLNRRLFLHKLRKYFFYDNSIVLQTTYNRLKLLKKYGVKLSVGKENYTMSTNAELSGIPNQNDLPSSWNPIYKQKAKDTFEAVLLKWSEELIVNQKEFVVFYIPRESEWKKNDTEQDSWKSWLKTICFDNKITFIDPTQSFFKYNASGERIYDDHFSEIGHQAFANSFIEWFNQSK
tara:strand:- start:3388 stop:4398 length:1011 start_codon:yes stop_codon:yes gene_type:complete